MGGVVVAPSRSFVEKQQILEVADLVVLPLISDGMQPLLFIFNLISVLLCVEAYVVELQQMSILSTRLLFAAEQLQEYRHFIIQEVEYQACQVLQLNEQALPFHQISTPAYLSDFSQRPYFLQGFELPNPEMREIQMRVLLVYAIIRKLKFAFQQPQPSPSFGVVLDPLHTELIAFGRYFPPEHSEPVVAVLLLLLLRPAAMEVIVVVLAHVLYLSLDVGFLDMPRLLQRNSQKWTGTKI